MTVRTRSGFTLIELLVAMAILGILIGAIVSLTGSFLGFSRHTNVINANLSDLNDASGYMVMNVRRAFQVYGDSGNTVDITWTNGSKTTTFTCADPSSWNPSSWPSPTIWPCVALAVPNVDRTSGSITGFHLLAYRFVPMSAWSANPGFPSGWDGASTPIMLEYEVPLSCSSPCTSVPPITSAVTATRVSLVLSNLAMNIYGSGVLPLTIGSPGVSSKNVTFRMQLRGSGTESATTVPSDGPLVISATPRPQLGTNP